MLRQASHEVLLPRVTYAAPLARRFTLGPHPEERSEIASRRVRERCEKLSDRRPIRRTRTPLSRYSGAARRRRAPPCSSLTIGFLQNCLCRQNVFARATTGTMFRVPGTCALCFIFQQPHAMRGLSEVRRIQTTRPPRGSRVAHCWPARFDGGRGRAGSQSITPSAGA